MKKLGDVKKTNRGFERIQFQDLYQADCSLQMSSLAEYEQPGVSAIWLGPDDVKPKVLGDTGWVPYPIPNEVLLHSRMHLNRDQVESLIAHLKSWLEDGSFEFDEKGNQ